MEIITFHGWEDLILLKCEYYPNQSIDPIYPLFKYQRCFSYRNRKTQPKIYSRFQRSQNKLNNLEKGEQTWKAHTS